MDRKHCGKRRNCLLRAISPFPTVFSKGLFPRGVKRRHYVGKGFKKALWEKKEKNTAKPPFSPFSHRGVSHGSVVKCLTCNPEVLGLSCTRSSVFFHGNVLGQDTSESQPSTGETHERHK